MKPEIRGKQLSEADNMQSPMFWAEGKETEKKYITKLVCIYHDFFTIFSSLAYISFPLSSENGESGNFTLSIAATPLKI
jgi:hypothetical protein